MVSDIADEISSKNHAHQTLQVESLFQWVFPGAAMLGYVCTLPY